MNEITQITLIPASEAAQKSAQYKKWVAHLEKTKARERIVREINAAIAEGQSFVYVENLEDFVRVELEGMGYRIEMVPVGMGHNRNWRTIKW